MANKLLSCINQKRVDYIPIWFMRQAGRYLPEFRKIRKNNPDFIKLFSLRLKAGYVLICCMLNYLKIKLWFKRVLKDRY